MAELVDAHDSNSCTTVCGFDSHSRYKASHCERLFDYYVSMYYVYAIASIERNYIYVGLTDNVIRRFNEHNLGKNKTTKPYRPYLLIFTEECIDRGTARNIEKYYKSGVGKEKLKKLKELYL